MYLNPHIKYTVSIFKREAIQKAELLKALYEHTEGRREAESVTDFLTRFVKKDDEMEDRFLEAVYDTRLAGFRGGMNTALQLFSEIHGTNQGKE